jgi:hypothetical protein
MSIEYTYEIVSVDTPNRCMEVRYTSAGRNPVHVSARIPYAGESLDSVILMYSPVRYWEEQAAEITPPVVGLTGAWTPPPLPAVTTADYINAVQFALDAKARERNYDGILSACTYATSTVPKFQAEGQACVAWRDAVWAYCYAVMAQVAAQEIPQPTVEALVAGLPELVWP